ncbi:uncharacterized protein BX663DRAFT_505568 [Cokeromyces recurvatus]|uniref:uncharacterized protein n=1 Tax=Cokeromyces recurvatus TaxID=90255 RepID=UPI00221F7A41|nr:uncharacterized protein BX663DRAFT_505568 [Cokeromyces recurvatus]KAI7903887.1 hypothetical protein BX663DRAFT_505568 [Cokeromyces recurvatus]
MSTDLTLPTHPAQPQWQTFREWNTMKTPQSFEVVKTEHETQEELFERFGLTEENGEGWGDASEAQDAGWGVPDTKHNGW